MKKGIKSASFALALVTIVNLNLLSVQQTLNAEGFENGLGEWSLSGRAWIRQSGPTPNPETGPSAAASGDFYMYAAAISQPAYLSASFDFTAAQLPVLQFDYHMYGALIGKLSVDLHDGSTWHNNFWSLAGQQQISSDAPWKAGEVDLSQFSGNSNVIIRFNASSTQRQRSDIAIDNIVITDTGMPPLFMLSVNNGTGGGEYQPGTSVSISAAAPAAGYMFSHWSVDPVLYSGNILKRLSSATSFVMPTGNVQLTPNYMTRPLVEPRYAGAQPNEWTMDYDAALAYAQENDLNTVVMFNGAWWCPYCKSLEEKVLISDEWQAYIDANPVMLVMLDFQIRAIYNLPRDDPRNRCFLWDEQFLTANGITEAEGDARLAYNHQLEQQYCVPSSFARYGYPRVGYPTWVIHRPDGSRCARLNVDLADNSISTSQAVDIIARRFGQALLADPADEMDDEALMSPPEIKIAEGHFCSPLVLASLSENDLADNYKFTAEQDQVFNFYLGKNAEIATTPLLIAILDSSGTNVVANTMVDPLAITNFTFQAPANDDYYVRIKAEKELTNLIGYSFSVAKGCYADWQNYYFSEQELLDGLITGDNDDPDGDGIVNALEFAYGSNPRVPDTSLISSGGCLDDYLRMTFRKNKLAYNVEYVVESCTNLCSAQWETENITEVNRKDTGEGHLTVTVRHDIPVTAAPARFMRLKVVMPE
ncbi:MAG: thioredoxin family protein [Kiritimatiellae bacterium]|nr:thioredoxin family protein [Kiritimatiellia bacterium]